MNRVARLSAWGQRALSRRRGSAAGRDVCRHAAKIHVEFRLTASRPGRKPADLPDFDIVELRIDHADPVKGYANLLADSAGRHLTVAAPRDRLAGLCEGAALRLSVRRAPGRIFADPDTIRRR